MDMDMGGMNMSDHHDATSSHKMAAMHMTFFWGSDAQILFSGWPGAARPGMYALALVLVFAVAVAVEWLSHSRLLSAAGSRLRAAFAQTLLYALRVGLAYLVMLAVMSFNAGVFLAAVAGHAAGFLAFGSRLFRSSDSEKVTSDLPPMSC